ncbi:MAG: NUDIX hydrolase [Anaerolineae bacterium]|nr:NUDIX hydrolase [Anaerolineae bacterium]
MPLAPPKVLRQTVLHQRDHIAWVRYDLRLPNGTAWQREVLHHPGAVAIVPLKADGQVVLVRQYRLAAATFLLELPAGTLEPGEAPAACARRELQEEAGYLPGQLDPLGRFFVAPGISQEQMDLFVARDLIPSRLPADADEALEVVEMPLAQALHLAQTGEIRDAKTLLGLLLVSRP